MHRGRATPSLSKTYYSSAQHKVECAGQRDFTDKLVADTQDVLRKYRRAWEVIFVVPQDDGRVVAYGVHADGCVRRGS